MTIHPFPSESIDVAIFLSIQEEKTFFQKSTLSLFLLLPFLSLSIRGTDVQQRNHRSKTTATQYAMLVGSTTDVGNGHHHHHLAPDPI